LPSPEAIRRELLRRATEEAQAAKEEQAGPMSLATFVRLAWHVLEPSTPYVHGWHIDLICAHLEAVTRGEITRLLINVPPGTMKSLLVSVFWPAWEWGPMNMPGLRYLSTAWSLELAAQHAGYMKSLVASDWYQGLWGDRVVLDKKGDLRFTNTAHGSRRVKAFAGLTGGRGDRLIIDDPHSTETAESELERARTIRVFRESVPLRLNDAQRSAIVIIMQRLHENDVSGVAIALQLGYVHVMLPMEFEPGRKCITRWGQDPRTYENELLFPERFPRATVDRDKVPMGSYAVAGQLQQRPQPREGGMFKLSWFGKRQWLKALPVGLRYVRYWDLAATEETYGQDPAWTAGVLMGIDLANVVVVADVIRCRMEAPEVRRLMRVTAEMDQARVGGDYEVAGPQDPGQAGKAQRKDLIANLAGFVAHFEPETGDKATRAEPFAAQCEAGNVTLVEGAWNQVYLDELTQFPGSKYKDQVDASSGAYMRLVRPRPHRQRGNVPQSIPLYGR
jgi:predicted phage terminase large subunit-like protein